MVRRDGRLHHCVSRCCILYARRETCDASNVRAESDGLRPGQAGTFTGTAGYSRVHGGYRRVQVSRGGGTAVAPATRLRCAGRGSRNRTGGRARSPRGMQQLAAAPAWAVQGEIRGGWSVQGGCGGIGSSTHPIWRGGEGVQESTGSIQLLPQPYYRTGGARTDERA